MLWSFLFQKMRSLREFGSVNFWGFGHVWTLVASVCTGALLRQESGLASPRSLPWTLDMHAIPCRGSVAARAGVQTDLSIPVSVLSTWPRRVAFVRQEWRIVKISGVRGAFSICCIGELSCYEGFPLIWEGALKIRGCSRTLKTPNSPPMSFVCSFVRWLLFVTVRL